MHDETNTENPKVNLPQNNESKYTIKPFDPSKVQLTANDKAFIQWYDARCKRILSNKMLLAHLLKATMHEFQNIKPEVIAWYYIEGKPRIENKTKNIQGLRNERDDPKRHPNFFDIILWL